MQEAKNQLRVILKQYRDSYHDDTWILISESIQSHVISLVSTLNAQSIGCYLHSERTREVHTNQIVTHFLNSGIAVCVPLTGSNGSMKMVGIDNDTPYTLNKWGIREPSTHLHIHEVVPDLIVVPMLGADYKGFRIGYGKGYYDRYLTGKASIKIGVCPQSCLMHELPVDEYDIPMDYLITENGIVRKNAK
jgi:5-formyltetrahydrofolate cyclo-ligase